MKETTVQIDGMMSIFDGAGVEKQIKCRDGVVTVDANFLSGTAALPLNRIAVKPGDRRLLDVRLDLGRRRQRAAVEASEDEHVSRGVIRNKTIQSKHQRTRIDGEEELMIARAVTCALNLGSIRET